MTTSEVQTFARAFYEELVNAAIDSSITQLRAAMPKLAEISTNDPDAIRKIKAAMPRGVSSEVRNFITLLVQQKAAERLPDILEVLEQYKQGDMQHMTAEVISAVLLTEEQQNHIARELQQRYETTLDLQFRQDETLIGGLVIRVGDQVLDTSLRARLSAIERSMLAH